MFKRNLLPHMHVIKLVGGTGDGKTEFSVVFAEPKARKILIKCVGRTNSTVRERMLVYTTALSDKLIVAASIGEEILERKMFSDMVISAIAKVVRQNGKVVASVVGKEENDFEEALYSQLNERNNTCAVFHFLTDEEKKEFVDRIVEVYRTYNFGEYGYEIYNATKNSMSDKDVKENSNKFLGALKFEVERIISLITRDFTTDLLKICEEVNSVLRGKFFEYFNENVISEDGFYYKEIPLDGTEEENKFIDAMFTSNNLQGGERLSLEVLCGQIFIYVPMNKAVKDIIGNDNNASKVFVDEYGEYTFGILDTRGLYHTGVVNDDNGDYLNELIYQGDTDAVAMVVPLQGDSNEKKIYELYRKLLEAYKKQTPLFMINNKVDLFIDALRKDDFMDDPFSVSMEVENEMSADEIIEHVAERVKELQGELQEVQNKARRNLEIIALPCYLKRDEGMKHEEIVKKYNIVNVVQSILLQTAEFLVKTSVKISINLKGEDDVDVEINRDELVKRVRERILESDTDKKVFEPGSKNIGDNMGICPHGNSYNALKRRLKYGDGYSCRIDEAYYFNCKSFTIDFTGNLRNFISEQFLGGTIHRALKIINGSFPEQKDEELFWKQVEKNFDTKKFVSILLYDHALRDAELTGFGFATYFRGFLKNSMPFFYKGMIDEKQYADALEEVLRQAVKKTIAMNVVYK
ncbi:MAG: hypothetical protein J1E85_10580 [Ruminococcus sp.]|nr:hypothetical protein [Ruminococcus sp.]